MSLALVGRFLITRPPGKPKVPLFYDKFAITLTSPFPELLIHSEFVSFLILQVLFVPSPPLSIPTRFQALGEQETTSHFLPQFQYNAQPKYSQYTVAGRFLSSFCPLIFSSFRPWQSRHVLHNRKAVLGSSHMHSGNARRSGPSGETALRSNSSCTGRHWPQAAVGGGGRAITAGKTILKARGLG